VFPRLHDRSKTLKRKHLRLVHKSVFPWLHDRSRTVNGSSPENSILQGSVVFSSDLPRRPLELLPHEYTSLSEKKITKHICIYCTQEKYCLKNIEHHQLLSLFYNSFTVLMKQEFVKKFHNCRSHSFYGIQ